MRLIIEYMCTLTLILCRKMCGVRIQPYVSLNRACCDAGHVLLQVRVVMNKEPKHFMKMFGGRLLVFKVSELNPVSIQTCVDYMTY